MRQKVLDINVEGVNLTCILDRSAKVNPYRLYRRWFENGRWHQKQIERYANFISILCHIKDYAIREHWGYKD